jgi:hypothetical protein
MAICYNGILGGFKGTVGTVIGSNWRGKDVMKSKPRKTNKPPVPAQVDQRKIFPMMVSFLSSVEKIIDLGFKPGRDGTTPINNAVTYNLQYAVAGSSPEFSIDYPKIRLSKGNLLPAYYPKLSILPEHTINITWTTHPGAFDPYDDEDKEERATDNLLVLIYNPETKCHLSSSDVIRETGSINLKVPLQWGTTPNHVWILFASAVGKQVSSSQYLGSFTVQECLRLNDNTEVIMPNQHCCYSGPIKSIAPLSVSGSTQR